ncbi:hypothetical protein PGTUg99_006178 [Puccinia graminis f. sp. tritici]|uniref:Uncharacterized protein n=1 Tax=Puccinia graminis f. sp. tritici TaxID=56615 RepID=A0A5B0S283_PUCGR|nr:hypothetical protein PGTUg99_006178 [Puccinia graminis f. sp. tritici]
MNPDIPDDNPSGDNPGGDQSGDQEGGQTGPPEGGAVDSEHNWISDVVDGVQANITNEANSSTTAGDTTQGGSQSSGVLNLGGVTDRSRLEADFVVDHARGERANVEERETQLREERRVRKIANKATINEHCDAYSRGIQHFLKFFLGGPTVPQDYPASPTPDEKGGLYWVDKRSKIILEQLERLRTSLSAKSPAEQDFYLAQAEKEIRKKIVLPAFHPAPRKGDLGGGRPISLQTKGDVERALALAGISRFTFDWNVPRDEDSAWNSVVIEVMGKKSVEWLRRTMKISEEEEAQAAAIIKRWLQTKSREIQQYGEMDITEYNKIKSKKSTKALYMRWRKKIKEERCRVADQIFKGIPQLAVVLEDKDCHSDIEDAQEGVNPVRVFPGYRSIHLTNILHNLDRMVQAQTTHHKKIETNKKMYARSASNHAPTVGGAIGVARDWPIDCYDETFWKGLSQFERDTISKVPAVNIQQLAETLAEMCRRGTSSRSSGQPDQGVTSRGQKRGQLGDGHDGGEVGGVAGPSGSMNID